jgi:hypothetical protein
MTIPKPKNPAAVALGSISTAKKAAAARENGKKGGKTLRQERIQNLWKGATKPRLNQLADGTIHLCQWRKIAGHPQGGCELEGRRFINYDAAEKYLKEAIKRWEKQEGAGK